MQRIGGVQQHRAGDPAVPPLVLVLDVRGVGPLDDREPQRGPLAGAHHVGEVELARPDGSPWRRRPAARPHATSSTLSAAPTCSTIRRPAHSAGMSTSRSYTPVGLAAGECGGNSGQRHPDVGVLRQVAGVLHGPGAGHLGRGPPVAERRVRGRQQLEAPGAVESAPSGWSTACIGSRCPGGHLGLPPHRRGCIASPSVAGRGTSVATGKALPQAPSAGTPKWSDGRRRCRRAGSVKPAGCRVAVTRPRPGRSRCGSSARPPSRA